MVAVIGDVHGCFFTLQALVDKINNKYPDIRIYCVGDLVDRGRYSFEVIDFVISQNINFTAGNHDWMFYSFFKDPGSSMASAWLHNGSDSTIQSYEKKNDFLIKHLEYIEKAPLFFNTKDCFISHAGISETFKTVITKDILDDDEQLLKILRKDLFDKNSIIWCRTGLMNIDKLQVVGHTHRKEVEFNLESNAVYIDTTAFGMNKLSCVIVEDNKVLEIIDQKTAKDDSDNRWNYYL